MQIRWIKDKTLKIRSVDSLVYCQEHFKRIFLTKAYKCKYVLFLIYPMKKNLVKRRIFKLNHSRHSDSSPFLLFLLYIRLGFNWVQFKRISFLPFSHFFTYYPNAALFRNSKMKRKSFNDYENSFLQYKNNVMKVKKENSVICKRILSCITMPFVMYNWIINIPKWTVKVEND